MLWVVKGGGHRGVFFTIKAIMQASHIKTLDQELGNAWVQYRTPRKFREPVVFCLYTNATSSGSDPISV